jgi:uncharacterized membrane protein (DUF106 family)
MISNYENDVQNQKMKKELDFRNERALRLGQIDERKVIKEKEKQLKIAMEQAEMLRARNLAFEEEVILLLVLLLLFCFLFLYYPIC